MQTFAQEGICGCQSPLQPWWVRQAPSTHPFPPSLHKGTRTHKKGSAVTGLSLDQPNVEKNGGRDGSPILEVRGISKRFPGVQALDKVDFDVRRGEVHVLLGENGAGKS